jgi:hypothetical protein
MVEMTETELQAHLTKISEEMAEMNRVKVDSESLAELAVLAGTVNPSDIDATIRILLNNDQFTTLKNPGAIVSMLIQMDEVVLTLVAEIIRLREVASRPGQA